MKKKLVLLLLLCTGLIAMTQAVVALDELNPRSRQSNGNSLFQVSPVAAFADSLWDGWMKIPELKAHGDFGVGTFDGVDGEMVVLDGTVYKVKGDGSVVVADNHTDFTPLAMVTRFQADYMEVLTRDYTYQDLLDYIETKFPSSYGLYAIKISGYLKNISARSGDKVTKPYPPVSDLFKYYVKNFNYEDPVEATMVGLWCPAYFAGGNPNPLKVANLPGYHFHFVSQDKTKGGHLYSAKVSGGAVLEICYISKLELVVNL
jgi:acetolactate decarboxylase